MPAASCPVLQEAFSWANLICDSFLLAASVWKPNKVTASHLSFGSGIPLLCNKENVLLVLTALSAGVLAMPAQRNQGPVQG